MDLTFLVGVVGALILVLGAAYPLEHVSHPAHSIKNRLFALGGFCMLVYSLFNYMAGGTLFFVILQIFINITSVLMLLNTKDKFDTPFISIMGTAMVLWSLSLFEGLGTVVFVIGLSFIGLGYALDMGTFKRELALTLGSALIALFSYLEANMLFFLLNFFFALFSGYYTIELLGKSKKRR